MTTDKTTDAGTVATELRTVTLSATVDVSIVALSADADFFLQVFFFVPHLLPFLDEFVSRLANDNCTSLAI